MSWVTEARDALAAGKTVQVRPAGGSMRGRIESGQLVTLQPAGYTDIQVQDVIFIRWKGNYLLHLVIEKNDNRVCIGNTLGKINGWIDAVDVLGKVIAVAD